MASNYATSVTWDGHELHSLFVVEAIERQVMGGASPVTQTVGMSDGVALVGMRYDAPKITLTLACIAETAQQIREAWAMLASWLHVDGPRRLEFSDDGGWYYDAIPQGGAETALLGLNAERATITFLVPDAKAWAIRSKTASFSTMSVADIRVSGTAPAYPVITSSSAIGEIVIYYDNQPCLTVDVGGVVKSLVIDCASRTVTIGGNPALLSLDQDFLAMDPGVHTMDAVQLNSADPGTDEPSGTGPQTISFEVEWRDSRWC